MIVNFGCGASAKPGYVNIDGSLTVLLARLPIPAAAYGSRAEFVRSIRTNRVRRRTATGLRFPARSLQGFYASHVFEHLERSELEHLLTRVRQWLAPGGVLRSVLPDLRKFAAAYSNGEIAADKFVTDLNLATSGLTALSIVLGRTRHRWMYDVDSFSSLLAKTGYADVCEKKFGESADPRLAALDWPGHREQSFYVEATNRSG